MKLWTAHALALSLIAPAVAPAILAPSEIVGLQASCDSSLGSLRAGRVDAPTHIAIDEHAELLAAQKSGTSLGEMRGGMTDQQMTWLLVGAVIVLLIVLL